MSKRLFVLTLLLIFIPAACFARGFGGGGGFHGGGGFGGGMHVGGMGGMGGGFSGMGGGMRVGGALGGPNSGGMGIGGAMGGLGGTSHLGGQLGGGNFGGYGSSLGGGMFDRGGFGASSFGGADRGGLGGQVLGGLENRGLGGQGLGGLENRGLGGQGLGGGVRDSFGDRYGGAAPTRSSINSFLGLPSDEGMHGLSGASGFDVNRGAVEGPRGGYAAGATVTGPRGNEVGRGVAVGPGGGVAAGRGFEGAGGAAGIQGGAIGPGGRVAGGAAVRGPEGGAAARGFVAGPGGVAGGFARVTPSGRYMAAAGVRTNFNHWGVYGADWYRRYPGAWMAAGWGAGYAWRAATWDSLGYYMDYYPSNPMYYDYGNNVTYQDNSVYVDGQSVGTAEQYYDQASQLATTGTQAQAPADGDWMPLGVFGLTKTGEQKADVTVQLAVNKQGVLRGNYTDVVTNQTQLVHGSVDKKTQRVAFTVGENTNNVVETGLYNLTKDEAPALIHFGKDRTEQWLLVRLKQPEGSGQ